MSEKFFIINFVSFIQNTLLNHHHLTKLFIEMSGVQKILHVLTIANYPAQLVILSVLIDLAVFPLVKQIVKTFKIPNQIDGYIGLLCDIWRYEMATFYFLDDEFMFQNQSIMTTFKNIRNNSSPAITSMVMYAQPKIYLLLLLIEFNNEKFNNIFVDQSSNYLKQTSIKMFNKVKGLKNKITIVHIIHYYTLKIGEVWKENDIVSYNEVHYFSNVELESIKIMTKRHANILQFLKNLNHDVKNINSKDVILTLPIVNFEKSNDIAPSKRGKLLPNTIRALICGPSNCGKTNLMFTLLTDINGLRFENVYIYSKSLHQSMYQLLMEVLGDVQGVQLFTYENGDDVLSVNNVLPNSVFIFDDVVMDKKM
ncbi:uncharacterized protein LOC126897894 [Daktulosphaira vitifoliae]|uniref:uncharacterized protein LOC126897894 n=1 Tax=Daktulosphaira vitifoliae TaxID=58002 RepID=UPI0021A9CDAE|nr:uncharacterized protein LOC126897894 [Daktulosphaira vitifoliae]